MTAPHDIILFHYPVSPFARRITWYLALRQISHAQCLQPPTLPRLDLNRLGISYRRIPILSYGSSIYCDTRLILQKLELHFPNSTLAANSPDEEATRRLLESWTIDGSIFARATQALPTELPIMKDPKFIKDREAYTGRSWSKESVRVLRPEALVHLCEAFDMLENVLLSDGRPWVYKTRKAEQGPSLADIDAVWPFHWLLDMKVALPERLVSRETYPKASHNLVKGEEAAKAITSASIKRVASGEDEVDEKDPTGLKRGMLVESWPTDSGFRNRDRGKLVMLNRQECVMENEEGIRIHHPRWNFRVQGVSGEEAKL